MKKVGDFFKESKIQLVETLIIIGIPIITFCFDIATKISTFLPNKTKVEDLNSFIIVFIRIGGNLAIAIVLVISFYLLCRYKINSKHTMNTQNCFHEYPYWWYMYCSKFLGFKTCNLVLVPNYLQYKLVINQVFDEFLPEQKEYPEVEDDTISVTTFNERKRGGDINLIISDTYPINIDKLPNNTKELYTIIISRDKNVSDNSRHYSPKLIETVTNQVRSFNNGTDLNVYSSVNPFNAQRIAEQAFKQGDRGPIEHLSVYKQERVNWKFTEPVKIY